MLVLLPQAGGPLCLLLLPEETRKPDEPSRINEGQKSGKKERGKTTKTSTTTTGRTATSWPRTTCAGGRQERRDIRLAPPFWGLDTSVIGEAAEWRNGGREQPRDDAGRRDSLLARMTAWPRPARRPPRLPPPPPPRDNRKIGSCNQTIVNFASVAPIILPLPRRLRRRGGIVPSSSSFG